MRQALILFLAGASGVATTGCGDGESIGPAATVSIALAGVGRGTVTGSAGGLSCTNATSTGTPSGNCEADLASGTQLTLSASPATGSSFAGWSGSGVTCPANASCAITVTESRTITATFDAAPATRLAFVLQPTAIQAGGIIAPPVRVAVQDAAGQTVANRTDAITLGIAANPGGATLGGQLTRNAVGGVANFPDLTLDQAGNGYTLTASASGLSNDISTEFNVSAEPVVAQLGFAAQPSVVVAGVPLAPAVTVVIQDQQGNLLTDRTDQITLALETTPAGGTLSGATTVTAVAGIATFSNLTVQKAGTGTLAATTPNAGGAISNPFEIVAGPPRLVVENSTRSQEGVVDSDVPNPPSVKVTDAYNNPVANVPVTWEVTAGGGSVVASAADPAVGLTESLGLSTVVSWTIGPEVGTENNELRASVSGSGVVGSPVIFTASGTADIGSGEGQ